jgi:hypothetical protein
VSRDLCHKAHVTIYLFIYLFFGKSGVAYRWRVCYQRGLPRLVFGYFCIGPTIRILQYITYLFKLFKQIIILYIFTRPGP